MGDKAICTFQNCENELAAVRKQIFLHHRADHISSFALSWRGREGKKEEEREEKERRTAKKRKGIWGGRGNEGGGERGGGGERSYLPLFLPP